MGPLWGVLADRYGRKPMLMRAMIGGGLTVGLMGFSGGPLDLVVLRLLQSASSGTVAAATALVAPGTPRARVGWALGLLSSAVAVGSALGPLVGGLAASVTGDAGRGAGARFGVSSSATAFGFAAGPLGGGLLASRADPATAIVACSACAVILAGVLGSRAREPRR